MSENISESHRKTSKRVVLRALRTYGPMTVDGIMDRIPKQRASLEWTRDRIRPACSELAKDGLAYVYSANGGVSDRGRPCKIWAATPTLFDNQTEDRKW